MAKVIQQLNKDHQNIGILLQVLAEELNIFATSARRPDFRLMREIIEYLQDFMDEVHHPQEDALYQLIVQKQSEPQEFLLKLMRQHTEINKKNREFLIDIDQIYNDTLAPKNEMEANARAFIQLIRDHIDLEESEAFPLADQILNQSDWSQLEAMRQKTVDPLFGQEVDSEFERLRGHLIQRGVMKAAAPAQS